MSEVHMNRMSWPQYRERIVQTKAPVFPPVGALEHAAVIETSLMLHHPELVQLDLIPDDPPAQFPSYDMYPTRTEWVPPSGVLSSARGASRENGSVIADEVITRVADAVRSEFKLRARP
jgi:creatinine amidohydrolase